MTHRKATQTSSLALAAILAGLSGLACPGALADQYDPPAGYYDSATATTAAPLSQQLQEIIDDHIQRSYDDARFALQILDSDPNDPTRMILLYNGHSVDKNWDFGVTWNREHTWPRSRGVDTSGPDNSDLHMLRPVNPSINGARGNEPFGTLNSSYWDPDALGGADRGEVARTQFYADVRYDGSDAATTDLVLVDTFPVGSQMGDLSEMLEWHFAYPPDQPERRRNHLIWSADPDEWFDPEVFGVPVVLNQGNRNPFVDHPEYAWVIWGSGPNNATLYVGASPAGDGSSSILVDLGRVLDGAAVPTAIVPIEKANDHPAAYRVSASGDATSPQAGLPLAYPFTPAPVGVPQPTVTVGIVTSGPGFHSGDVVIDNAQLTSAAAGMGSADADDTITVTATVLNHANASFNDAADADLLEIDFGSVTQHSSPPSAPFSVHNLSGAFAADLDLDTITPSGDASVLTTDLAAFSGLTPGSFTSFLATLDTGAAPASYEATYTLSLSDEDVPGEATGQTLTLTLLATIVPPSPCLADLDDDFDTDVFDFGLFIGNFGSGPGATPEDGDFNGDGFVDVLDFAIFAPDFGCGT